MTPSDQRRFARKQLRELRDDVTDLEVRMKHGGGLDDGVSIACDAVRRLIENKIENLSRFQQADD